MSALVPFALVLLLLPGAALLNWRRVRVRSLGRLEEAEPGMGAAGRVEAAESEPGPSAGVGGAPEHADYEMGAAGPPDVLDGPVRTDAQGIPASGSPAARLADLFGLSLAAVAVLGTLTYYFGLHLNAISVGALLVLCAAAGMYRLRIANEFRPAGRLDSTDPEHQPGSSGSALHPERGPAGDAPHPVQRRTEGLSRAVRRGIPQSRDAGWTDLTSLLPLLALAGILVFRFWQARTLVVPAWVDSVHHTLLVRLVLETGGVPATFAPYMPVNLVYHAGFHTNAALFAFLSRLEPARAVLVFGQVLNAAVALGVYRLAIAIWGDWRRGLAAMLLVGFAFQMPSYYLTWGRYTLLTGIFLLTIAVSALLDARRGPGSTGGHIRLAILTAGLLFTHYLVAIFFALFLGVVVLEGMVRAAAGYFRSREILRTFPGVLAGGLFMLPWIVRVLGESRAFIGVQVILPGESLDAAFFANYLDYLGYLLGPLRSHILHWAGLAGLVLLGWRRPLRVFAGFTLVAVLLNLPWGVTLSPFRPDHGVILAFLPASLFIGDGLVSLVDLFRRPALRLAAAGVAVGLVLFMAAWGVRDMADLLHPDTVFTDAADLAAMDWIAANTPEEAVFLINTAYWQGGAYRGADGGWWITPITGRRTSLPPALYLNGPQDYVLALLDRAARMSRTTDCDAAFLALAAESGATHVYLHQGRGSLQPLRLGGCAGVRLVYAEGEVFIFALNALSER